MASIADRYFDRISFVYHNIFNEIPGEISGQYLLLILPSMIKVYKNRCLYIYKAHCTVLRKR